MAIPTQVPKARETASVVREPVSPVSGPFGDPAIVCTVLTAELPEIDLAAVYGVRQEDQERDLLVAALTLRGGTKLDPVALRRVVERRLPSPQRPQVVRIMETLPMTAGYRTRKRSLRQAGLGLAESAGETLYLAPNEDGYVTLESESQLASRV